MCPEDTDKVQTMIGKLDKAIRTWENEDMRELAEVKTEKLTEFRAQRDILKRLLS